MKPRGMRMGTAIATAIGGLALLLMLPVGAQARFTLVPAGKVIEVARSHVEVTPNIDWNRLDERVGRHASSWTIDGLSLNELTFFMGVTNNQPLFPDRNKEEAPLPRFEATMLPPDVAQLLESSYRVAIGGLMFSTDTIEPAEFLGQRGFRFQYSFVVQGEEVKRRGEANGAVINGRLYMIIYEAPELHYFERSLAAVRAIVDSATLRIPPPTSAPNSAPSDPQPERKQ